MPFNLQQASTGPVQFCSAQHTERSCASWHPFHIHSHYSDSEFLPFLGHDFDCFGYVMKWTQICCCLILLVYVRLEAGERDIIQFLQRWPLKVPFSTLMYDLCYFYDLILCASPLFSFFLVLCRYKFSLWNIWCFWISSPISKGLPCSGQVEVFQLNGRDVGSWVENSWITVFRRYLWRHVWHVSPWGGQFGQEARREGKGNCSQGLADICILFN